MRSILTIIIFLLTAELGFSQSDSSFFKRTTIDTSRMKLNLDAVYNRPFLSIGKTPVAIGGYLEANSQYSVTNGITEGLSFQMRRFTIFLASTISRKIRFLSELEFEDGTKEINIEFASIDFEFHPLLVFRGGIVMNPIGAFNQNHDGPKWEFIDRPISAIQLLPATFSNVGFGLHGKTFRRNWVFAYEAYLTNGFNDRIISNDQNKTFLPATKLDRLRFEESFNGEPLLTAKLAVRERRVGEIGFSYMTGVYNKFQEDGFVLDEKRRVNTGAVDFNSTIRNTKTYITGEIVYITVDIPPTYTQQYGTRQWGGFIDIVQPIIKKPILGYPNAVINFSTRLEYADWNIGRFKEDNSMIGDDVFSIVPGLSFRPSPLTVFRLNYRYQWTHDLFENPATRTAVIQIGFSSYF